MKIVKAYLLPDILLSTSYELTHYNLKQSTLQSRFCNYLNFQNKETNPETKDYKNISQTKEKKENEKKTPPVQIPSETGIFEPSSKKYKYG